MVLLNRPGFATGLREAVWFESTPTWLAFPVWRSNAPRLGRRDVSEGLQPVVEPIHPFEGGERAENQPVRRSLPPLECDFGVRPSHAAGAAGYPAGSEQAP